MRAWPLLLLLLLISVDCSVYYDARTQVTEYSRGIYNLASATYQQGDKEEASRARVKDVLNYQYTEDPTQHELFMPLYHVWWEVINQVSTEWFQDESEYDRWVVIELLIEYSRKLIQEPGRFDQNPWDFFDQEQLGTWEYLVYDAIHVEEISIRDLQRFVNSPSSDASLVAECSETVCLPPQ